MAARAISRRSEINTSHDQPIDPTASRHHSFSGPSDMFRLSCNSWNDCLVTTMTTALFTAIAMLMIGFLVPRFPPSSAMTELTAREYEAMAMRYSKRGYILDVVLVMGLACMVVVAVILSLLHALMYFNDQQSGSDYNGPSGRQSSTSNETFALNSRTVGYGGVDATEH